MPEFEWLRFKIQNCSRNCIPTAKELYPDTPENGLQHCYSMLQIYLKNYSSLPCSTFTTIYMNKGWSVRATR